MLSITTNSTPLKVSVFLIKHNCRRYNYRGISRIMDLFTCSFSENESSQTLLAQTCLIVDELKTLLDFLTQKTNNLEQQFFGILRSHLKEGKPDD